MSGTDPPHRPALWLVPVGICLLAVLPLPHGYDTLVRIIVCACAALVAYVNKEENQDETWFFAFMGVAIMFNPVIVLPLGRELWIVAGLAAALLFSANYSEMRETRCPRNCGRPQGPGG